MIYLDCDGVLADFNKGLANYGIPLNDNSFIHKPKSEWTKDNKVLDRQVRDVMAVEGFWLDIPPMKDALKLWEFCLPYQPFVLTAKPNDVVWGNRIANEKWIWLTDNLGPIKPSQFICCLRSEKKNFINSSNHKHQILVDDLEANCEEWKSVGGIGIVHISAANSIKELKKYV